MNESLKMMEEGGGTKQRESERERKRESKRKEERLI